MFDLAAAQREAEKRSFQVTGNDAPHTIKPDDIRWLGAYASGYQYGEQGILDALVGTLGDGNATCIEFGAGDGDRYGLTVQRLLNRKWRTLLIEADPANADALTKTVAKFNHTDHVTVLTSRVEVTGENSIDAIAERAGFSNPDVLVIDVDGPEWYIWQRMTMRPRILIVEHLDRDAVQYAKSPDVPPLDECGTVYDEKIQPGIVRQAKESALLLMAASTGYKRVWASRINSIFVLDAEYERLIGSDRRLNIGAGETAEQFDGYENIDIKTGTNAEKLPYPDNTFVEVYASHILEHFGHRQTEAVLKEWVRVLKPGGVLRVAVPSFEWVVKQYGGHTQAPLHAILMGGQVDGDDYHKAIFDEPGLRLYFERAGLWGVVRWTSQHTDCAALPCSLNLEGYKPVNRKLTGRVRSAMTMPRLAFSDNMYCAIRVCTELGIPFERTTGAYFDQNMERVIESQMGGEYVLTMDYDTTYTSDDVQALVTIMDSHPDVGAVAAMQVKRGDDVPLINRAETLTMQDHFADVFDVRSSHFGLTLIRCEALKAMKHPWFHHQTDPNGGWGDGRVDADVGFWHKMKEAGWRVCATSRVNVGHLQQMVSWVGNDYKPVHQHIDQYWKHGKPPNVR